jgi:hypothetical protein
LGVCDERVKTKSFKISKRNGEQGASSTYSERNSAQNPQIKPISHNKFNLKFYIPNKYLNPYGFSESRFPE